MPTSVKKLATVIRGSHLCRHKREMSIQQVTEADWLNRACGFKCTELFKSRLPLYVPVSIVYATVGPGFFPPPDTYILSEILLCQRCRGFLTSLHSIRLGGAELVIMIKCTWLCIFIQSPVLHDSVCNLFLFLIISMNRHI
jgi:hypothetical protein